MNPNDNSISRIHEIVSKATMGAIVLPTNVSIDTIAAATSLYLGLNKIGKSVALVCANSVNMPDILGADKIQTNLITSGNNLIISFPYTDGSIDKVDYNIQGNNFNLIVTPRPNFPRLDPNQVKYSYTGANLDFIIVIDSPTLNSLGMIYADNQEKFQGREIINIDRHLTNSFYGTVNFVNKASSSISELILKILQSLQIEIDKDMATNLYMGVASATNNFTSYSVNADTFEIVAQLLRQGAVKKQVRKPAPTSFSNSFNQPIAQPVNINPRINKEALPDKPIEEIEQEVKPDSKTPQDWLKPKIFRGGDLM